MLIKVKKSDDGSTATAYKTESQLFPKKRGVKLPKHLNHRAGKSRNFLKNGQDLRSRIRTGQFDNLRTRCTQKSQGYGQFKMRKFLMILVAVIGFGISANAQHISADIGGIIFSGKAQKTSNYGYIYTTNGGRVGIAIVYNEQSGKATIAYLKGGKEWHIGETRAVLSTSNTGISSLQITRGCNLYYANANSCNLPDYLDSSVISRLLGIDIRSSNNYYSCSKFTVEW